MNTECMFSSKRDDWETPQEFYDLLDREFHFTLDAAASKQNHKCDRFFTEKEDGLRQTWQGSIVFCNPPYGRHIGRWIQKAWMEWKKGGATIVMLIPARTDTKWFHEWIYNQAEVRFVKGRLKFGGSKNNAPFPSMVVIYRRVRSEKDNPGIPGRR